jgi:membrane protein implicated in regulation of membrane protease activity
MGKYVLLGSIVMETSLFASLIIIFAVVAVFLIWEVYRRRRRVKPAKTQARSDTSRK